MAALVPPSSPPKLGGTFDLWLSLSVNQKGSDIDLHLVRPGGRLGSRYDDCHPLSSLRIVWPERKLFRGCFKITGSGAFGEASNLPKIFTPWDWGEKGNRLDDPFVLRDTHRPGNHESIGLIQSEKGVYKVYVRYERDIGIGPSSCWVWVTLKAGTPEEKTLLFGPFTLKERGDAQLVCAIKMPEGKIVQGTPVKVVQREVAVEYSSQPSPTAPFPTFQLPFDQKVTVEVKGQIDVVHIVNAKGKVVFAWSRQGGKEEEPLKVYLLPGKYSLCAWRNGLKPGKVVLRYFVAEKPRPKVTASSRAKK